MKRFFEPGRSSAGESTVRQPSSGRFATYENAPEGLAPLAAAAGEHEPGSPTIVRIAVYDAMTAPPRIEEVFGDSAPEIIERLSARVYQVAHDAGGQVPYTVIRELAENLVHAAFADVVVSVLDEGNVVRFADSGPGIPDVERALRPGFSTATQDMRASIRGVGAGLPIASECMAFSGGGLQLDDNLGGGTVATVYARAPRPSIPDHGTAGPTGRTESPSTPGPVAGGQPMHDSGPSGATVAAHGTSSDPLADPTDPGDGAPVPVPVSRPAPAARELSLRQKQALVLVMELGSVGPTTVSQELSIALSTAHRDLALLEAEGLISANGSGKRTLTPLGISYVESLF